MSEDLSVAAGTKEDQYKSLLPQIKALITGESDLIANMGNITAALKEQFDWLWVGFYLVKNDELVLGPFQGPIACTRIQKNKGVCGSSWAQKKTLIVPDVQKFSGHIFCNSSSVSEIVIPIFSDNEVRAVLDVDSSKLATFDTIDQHFLEEISTWMYINTDD
ncbi:MAG: GAF domain-containing protein [Ginsengibacter sp.]